MTLNAHKRRQRKRCRRTRVFLDGVDVSRLCFFADARRGVVRLYRKDAEGKYCVENMENAHRGWWRVPPHLRPRVAREERRGHVRWGKAA